MSIFSKLFGKKGENNPKNNVEDFASLTRVYFQSVLASNLGISNIRIMPDLAQFKRLFKVPTQNGRLGLAEKAAGLLDGKSLVGKKDDIIGLLTEKLKIDEGKANEIYNAVAGFLAGGIADRVKGLFGKK